jgi:hypothetical protein
VIEQQRCRPAAAYPDSGAELDGRARSNRRPALIAATPGRFGSLAVWMRPLGLDQWGSEPNNRIGRHPLRSIRLRAQLGQRDGAREMKCVRRASERHRPAEAPGCAGEDTGALAGDDRVFEDPLSRFRLVRLTDPAAAARWI